jgi:hypothetical protein
MSRYVFKMPDLGEGTVTAEVVEWKVKVGDLVQEDQVIAEGPSFHCLVRHIVLISRENHDRGSRPLHAAE